MSNAADTAPAPQQVWDTLSQAERDAAYNNNAAVENSAALIAARDEAAAAFRAAHPAKLDLAYGPLPRQKIDLYPAASTDAPCLAFIHGGYWQRNSREQFAHYAEGAVGAGWSAAILGYTLAPDASVTEIVAEIGEALDWLTRECPQHGVAGPIVLSGWSAGAELVAMTLGHAAVTAGLAISGVYDLAPIRDTFLNGALSLSDDEVATASPLKLSVVQKPLAIAYGTSELPALVHDSRALHAMRAAQGAPGPLIPVEGADHFTILEELRAPGGRLVRAAQDSLAEALKNRSAA